MKATRRRFLAAACAPAVAHAATWQPVSIPGGVTRTWIGPEFWANRLGDWRLDDGRIECVTGATGDEVRTVALLTREIVAGAQAGSIRVRVGAIEKGGFCGFLIGAGAGRLDWRAAALVGKASGTGGGLLCTLEADGRLRFREHTSEDRPLAFGELAVSESKVSGGEELQLDIDGRKLTLRAGNVTLALEAEIAGGISLVSSAPGRYWFRDVATSGPRIAVHPERKLGPILGTLYSLNGKVLKLSAQLMPIGPRDGQTVKLEFRNRSGATSSVAPGFTAQFRIDDWDGSRDWEYRVVYGDSSYSGVIRRDPSHAPAVALVSCTIAAARNFEGGVFKPVIPGERFLGRYTADSIYFPYRELVENIRRHKPDLLVFAGDQLYESNPTRKEMGEEPTLDYLYKWFLWMWSFRELTAATPAIVMVDDHDVYHGNIWGAGGRQAPEGLQERGGYRCSAAFVNIVQRTQCGHNPDAFDPTPVDRGISVYYGSFRYGGVSFAILED
ncbi:MAG: hypothetical protein L0271_27720, partial [Gemmatimonadetes bacterium]|nr:hypothetical protein [Gemmatimonadota bacterium]